MAATWTRALYAAGDIADYPGKVRLISVGFGEAATAVNNADAVLDPEAPLFPGHSGDLAAGAARPPRKEHRPRPVRPRLAAPTAWPE